MSVTDRKISAKNNGIGAKLIDEMPCLRFALGQKRTDGEGEE